MSAITISAFSDVSESAAIAAVMGNAHAELAGELSGFHIIILGVNEGAAGGWQVVALLVTDPALESILQRRLKKEYEREKDDKEHPQKKAAHKGHQDNVNIEAGEGKASTAPESHIFTENMLHGDIFVYVPAEYENLSEELQPVAAEHTEKYDQEVHFHFIEKGSALWGNIQEMTPDYDFHKATLMTDELSTSPSAQDDARTPRLEEKPKTPRPKQPRPHFPELTDEA